MNAQVPVMTILFSVALKNRPPGYHGPAWRNTMAYQSTTVFLPVELYRFVHENTAGEVLSLMWTIVRAVCILIPVLARVRRRVSRLNMV